MAPVYCWNFELCFVATPLCGICGGERALHEGGGKCVGGDSFHSFVWSDTVHMVVLLIVDPHSIQQCYTRKSSSYPRRFQPSQEVKVTCVIAALNWAVGTSGEWTIWISGTFWRLDTHYELSFYELFELSLNFTNFFELPTKTWGKSVLTSKAFAKI